MYSTEKTLNDLGDKVPADTKSSVEAAIADLKSAMESGNIDDMKAKIEALQTASYKLAEIVYQTEGAAPDAGAQPNAADASGDTVEADYEVVDDDKDE